MELELINLRSQGKEIIATIDDILGPAEQRYFGEGYKRTQYQCSIHYQEKHAQGLISVSYKNDWSKKKTKERKPHLSTIDAFLIAGQISYGLIKRSFHLSKDQMAQSWIRNISIKAGAEALENLDSVIVNATLVNSEPSIDSMFGMLSRVKTTLDSMEVEVIIDHSIGKLNFCELSSEDNDEYFSDDFRLRRCQLENNTFSDSVCAVSSELVFQCPEKQSVGAMGQYPNALMMVDWLTCFAQLAQLIMYRLDNLDRSNTHNLWMRSVSVSTPYPIIPRRKHILTLRSLKNALVSKNDQSWRLSTVSGSVAGHPEFNLTAKLCHQLPQMPQGEVA
ncbi:syringolide biosynthetic protein AvrD1 [Vibrio mimicus]